MTAVRLKGGMGNQMFQYALGLQLAEQLGEPVRHDLSNLLYRNKPEGFVYRDLDLDVFRTDVEPLFPAGPLRTVFNRRIGKVSRVMQRIAIRGLPTVKEAHFHYDPKILDQARTGVIYNGWFQSPRYFAGVEDRVREHFRFARPILPESRELLARIEGTNAVCLNVRRTDFLKDATLNATDLAYFLRGVDYFGQTLEAPHFFVFSDDVAWCRENFELPFPTEVVGHEHKGFKFGNYLHLMQRCRHYLIPNSSFAWWAAWLNEGADKVVVAPKNWFADPEIDTSDLVPAAWVRL